MRLPRHHLVPLGIVLLTALAAAPYALAQVPSLNAQASKIADAISLAEQHDVIVLDFSGPDRKITPLGQKLADQFSAALARSSAKIRVEDRAQIPGVLNANSYPKDFVDWGEMAHAFAQDIRVQAFVMGELTIANDQLDLVISSYRADTGKNIDSVQIAWPMSDEERKMTAENLANAVHLIDVDSAQANLPNSGLHGYGTPACLHCPRAECTPEALRRKIQGTVELSVIVGEDGQVSDVRVLKPLPFGLTKSAMDAVKSWRLRPAMGPNGKPAAVRQIIDITFQL